MPDTKKTKKEVEAAEEVVEAQEGEDAADGVEEIEHLPDGDGLEDADAAEAVDEHDGEANGDIYRALEALQNKLMEVNDEASEKVLQVEQEYNLKRQPLYKERNQVIQQMPDFWTHCFRCHETLRELITVEDLEALQYLIEVNVEEEPDIKSGFTITFTFEENPYFSNPELQKKIRYLEDGATEITSLPPKWLPGNALTEGITEDEAEETTEGSGRKRKRQGSSFFSWFEEALSREQDLEIAEIIKDQIWPNPLDFFREEAEYQGDGNAGDPIELLDDGDVVYDEDGNPILEEGYEEVQVEEYAEGEGEVYEEGYEEGQEGNIEGEGAEGEDAEQEEEQEDQAAAAGEEAGQEG